MSETDVKKRWAVVEGRPEVIDRYMPGNYRVIGTVETDETIFVYIEGEDRFGWTLDSYVRPRLESGLYFGLTELPMDPFKAHRIASADPITPWPKDGDHE
jgi:hypothetical protein